MSAPHAEQERLVYVAEAARAPSRGWRAASLVLAALAFALLVVAGVFIGLWAAERAAPCPPPPPPPRPCPPGRPPAPPSEGVAAFSTTAGGCALARPDAASQVVVDNQSDRSAALYYAAAVARPCGNSGPAPCGPSPAFAPVSAAFPTPAGAARHVGVFSGAELEVYVAGAAVPCFVDGAAAAGTFTLPGPEIGATVAVVGTAALGYSAYVRTSRERPHSPPAEGAPASG